MEAFETIPLWFAVLFVCALFASVFARSLILCLGVVVLASFGIIYTRTMEGTNELVSGGLLAFMILIICFEVFQIITKVRRV